MDGAGERLRREGERDLALAHTTALFSRAKKLEPLARYLPTRAVAKATPGAMLDKLRGIVAATKGLDAKAAQ